MKIYDISMEIGEDMAVWKDKENKKPKFIVTAKFNRDGMNESRIDMDLHTGTHADAYFHMLKYGKTIDKIELSKFIGNCIVFDFSELKESILAQDFRKKRNENINAGDIVLLKTRNYRLKSFDFKFTFLSEDAAKFLIDCHVKLVGIDALGIERDQPKHETHRVLFEKDIPVVEGLDLSKIKEGRYFFIGLPLKVKGGDAAPLKAILIENDFRWIK